MQLRKNQNKCIKNIMTNMHNEPQYFVCAYARLQPFETDCIIVALCASADAVAVCCCCCLRYCRKKTHMHLMKFKTTCSLKFNNINADVNFIPAPQAMKFASAKKKHRI